MAQMSGLERLARELAPMFPEPDEMTPISVMLSSEKWAVRLRSIAAAYGGGVINNIVQAAYILRDSGEEVFMEVIDANTF